MIGHIGVQSFKNDVVLTVLLGEAERLYVLHEDLFRSGLRLEDIHYFGDVGVKRHGARVGCAAHEVGGDVGWSEFEHLNGGGLELVAERLIPGVDGGLGGAVGVRDVEGDKGQSRRHVDDGGAGLLLKMRQKSGGEADGAEQVGGDN